MQFNIILDQLIEDGLTMTSLTRQQHVGAKLQHVVVKIAVSESELYRVPTHVKTGLSRERGGGGLYKKERN